MFCSNVYKGIRIHVFSYSCMFMRSNAIFVASIYKLFDLFCILKNVFRFNNPNQNQLFTFRVNSSKYFNDV